MQTDSVSNTTLFDSPAKLNLFLHITGRRADGYHNLQTLFEIIDLNDTLAVTPNQTGSISLHPQDPNLPAADNLIVKAAHLLKKQAIINDDTYQCLGAEISIEKVIPMGGGLGGGSSNAAATFSALNALWQIHLPKQTLLDLGATLGADIPIFIAGEPCWAEGIGDQLQPIHIKPCHYLIIRPPCHASTQALFQHPKLQRNIKKISSPTNNIIDPVDFVSDHSNCFEPVARSLYPEIDQTLNYLKKYGPAALTGSGSCCFVPIRNRDNAQAAFEESQAYWTKKDQNYRIFLAKSRRSTTA